MREPEIITAGGGELVVRVSSTDYPLGALYAAAFDLVGRAWVMLDRADDGWLISVTPRGEEADEAALRGMADELRIQLAEHALRDQIRADNGELIAKLRTESFGTAPGGGDWGTADEDFGDLDDLDFLDDPLGIAVPWEEAVGAKGESEPSDDDGS
jgi:hypothetical protein